MLSQVAVANQRVSTWSAWGQNLLDDMDEQYINTLGTAPGGRYSAIWYGPSGEGVAGEPLLDNLIREPWEETIQEHITVECIFEPFIYIDG
jgi:hypothetical protein